MGNLRYEPGAPVWKKGAGYEGPGRVAAVFQTWMGDWRYVVEHQIAGGKGAFYHVYDDRQLAPDAGVAAGAVAPDDLRPGPGREDRLDP